MFEVHIKNRNGSVERHVARDRSQANGILYDQLLGNEEAEEVWVTDDGNELMREPASTIRAKIEAE
jgi:hypothetical protein